ncbi:small ribosomal subunit protein mS47 [Magnolia sinica]|uniref:small ribosomal subunit protein mS47 n=1 Tax=Magnolia sinica TaxID=86752 RepID=UPI00265B19EE|nr:small ribosomal subunit protein mS47 [Magnolia sinica]XP_058084969.1 small ribosomal subunit protein mS47 [Magnolia sinica]
MDGVDKTQTSSWGHKVFSGCYSAFILYAIRFHSPGGARYKSDSSSEQSAGFHCREERVDSQSLSSISDLKKKKGKMQSFKVLLLKRSLPTFRFHPHQYRSLSAHPSSAPNDDLQNQVLVEGNANSRTAILNRPSSLNALTTSMSARLKKLYESWEENSDIGFVVMKGSGRAFCAGGDVVTLCRLLNEGKVEDCKDFFRTLYKFIYVLGTYLKPHVAILDGVTMGGGAGVSVPGTFRVATDNTVFATPETQIGFHPDAGASFYLSHLPGYLGEYLALTGEKLNGVEMIACGLATHYSLSARLGWIEERLGKLVTDDPSVIETSLEQYGDLVYPDKRSVLHRIETVDKCFGLDTVEEIIDALESEAAKSYDEWCTLALKKLKEASPLSLKVSLRSIREGRYQSLDQCLVREYRMSLHGISARVSGDFCEGVRARLVEKDFAPKWDPPSLYQVSKDMVDHYFSPLSEYEPDLKLPTTMREAFI